MIPIPRSHSRPAEYGSRPSRVSCLSFQLICTRWYLLQIPVCCEAQQQTASLCVTSTRPPCQGSRCTQPVLGRPGPLRFPTSCHLGQRGGEITGLPLQENHDFSMMAQHALLLGPSGRDCQARSLCACPTRQTCLPSFSTRLLTGIC